MALSTRSGGTPPLRAISTAPMHVVELPYAWPQSSFQAPRCRLTRSCDYEGTQLEAGRSIRDYLSRRIRMENGYERFTKLLGRAALDVWGDMPRDIQEALFETAMKGQPAEREELARLLHERHPRTMHPPRPAGGPPEKT